MANIALNKYATESDYENDSTRPTDISTVSLVTATDTIHYDGVNVKRLPGVVPQVGDALWVDGNGNKFFYKGSTVNRTSLTAAGLTFVGVVGMRKGRKVWVTYKNNSNIQFLKAWAHKITGYEAGTPIVFRQYTADNTTSYVEVTGFTPTSDDVASVNAMATALNTFLLTKNPNVEGAVATNWSAGVMKDENGIDSVFVFIEGSAGGGIKNSQRQQLVQSGATSTLKCLDLIGFNANSATVERKNGTSDRYAVLNKSIVMEYYGAANNRSSVGSPTDSLTSGGIISEKDWNGENFPTVKEHFGTWSSYLDSVMVAYPAESGAVYTYGSDKKTLTDKYDEFKFYSILSSEERNIFFAFERNYVVDDGGANLDWHMPFFDEMIGIYGNILVDGSDPFSESFYKSSGSAFIYGRNRWVAGRFDSNVSSWKMSDGGITDGSSSPVSNYAFPVAVLEF